MGEESGEERHLTHRDLRVERGVEVLRGKLDYWQMVVRSGPSERPDPSTPDDVSNPDEWADYCAWWETVDHESEHRDYVALVAAVEHLLALHAILGHRSTRSFRQ